VGLGPRRPTRLSGEKLPRLGPPAHSSHVSPLLRSFASASLLLTACASSQYPSIDDPMPPPEHAGASSASAGAALVSAQTVSVSKGTLRRADVERVVDAGLGRFLEHVALEPSLVGGKFVGWSIVDLSPRDLWQGIDLQPGDVVSRVNGMAIEREVEAFDAFQAVRQAPALEVTYLRQNQPHTLRLTIVGASSPALPKAPPAPAPATAPAAAPATPG
jgi:hypothetical protein